MTPAYDLLSSSLHLPNESRTALELFEEYETASFEANGFYAYNDFLAFGERLGLSKKMLENILKTFMGYEKKVLQMLENSFLTQEAKERYEALFLDRLRAVRYQFR